MVHDFTIKDVAAPHARYRVTDAAGRQVPFLRWCDDETGEVDRFPVDGDGRFQIDGVTQRVVIVRERHPAPLTVTRLADGEPYFLPSGGVPCRP